MSDLKLFKREHYKEESLGSQKVRIFTLHNVPCAK